MNFNKDGYLLALNQMMGELRDGADQSWRETVELRYVQWLLDQSVRALKGASETMPKAHAVGPERERVARVVVMAVAQVQMWISGAAAVLNGSLAVKDPIRIEATLRLYHQAATAVAKPQEQPKDAA